MHSNYKEILKKFEQLVKEKGLKIGTPNFTVEYDNNMGRDSDECNYDENHEMFDAINAKLEYIIPGPNGDIILFQELNLLVKKEAESVIKTIRSSSLQEKIKNRVGFFPLLSIAENQPNLPSLTAYMDGERLEVMSLSVEYAPTKWNDEGVDLIITSQGKVKVKPIGSGKEPSVSSYAKGIFNKDAKGAFAMLLDFLCQKH